MKTEIVSTLNNASRVPEFAMAGVVNWRKRQLLIYLGFVSGGWILVGCGNFCQEQIVATDFWRVIQKFAGAF
ncbi:hypothetical protein L0337_18645 [candidate division KSB1 bacterium]|nr:hypothetical protein [candidate division KSB1 bacterium]